MQQITDFFCWCVAFLYPPPVGIYTLMHDLCKLWIKARIIKGLYQHSTSPQQQTTLHHGIYSYFRCHRPIKELYSLGQLSDTAFLNFSRKRYIGCLVQQLRHQLDPMVKKLGVYINNLWSAIYNSALCCVHSRQLPENRNGDEEHLK